MLHWTQVGYGGVQRVPLRSFRCTPRGYMEKRAMSSLHLDPVFLTSQYRRTHPLSVHFFD